MPVTKVTPSDWSGHTGVAIRQFADGTLLAVTLSGSTGYLWTSIDSGMSWQEHTPLATVAVFSQFHVTDLLPDGSVLLVTGFGLVGTTSNSFQFQYRPVTSSNSVLDVASSRLTSTLTAISATGTVTAGRLIGPNGNDFAFRFRRGASSRLSAGFREEPIGDYLDPTDWMHTGDGQTASAGSRTYFGGRTSGLAWATISSSGTYGITGGINRVAICDGTNVWLADDDFNNVSRLVRVPYSRLSQTAVASDVAGEWLAFAHYQGTIMAAHDAGGVHFLDTATASFETEVETHADFASGTFDAARYPSEEVMHLIRTDGSNAAYYRVVANTAPSRPTLTVPTARTESADLDLSWTFSDPEGHTQQSYELRRRTGTDDWEYWTGNAWVDTPGSSTIITHTTQTDTLTAGQWRDGTDDHWFAVRVRDDPPGEASEWSSDVRVMVVDDPNPDITLIADEDTSTEPVSVNTLTPVVEWTTDTQQEFRVRVYADSGGNLGTLRSDTGWLASGTERSRQIALDNDGETGHIRVSVRGYGSNAIHDSVEYQVDLPTPPGDSIAAVAVNGTYDDHLRITGSWSPPSSNVDHADLYRRKVGDSDDGVMVDTVAAANDAVSFDDWRVAHGVDYEYRWRAVTANGGVTVDSAWTS